MATKREITWVNVTIPAGDMLAIRRMIASAYQNAAGKPMPDGTLFSWAKWKEGKFGFDSVSMPASVVQRLLAGEVAAKPGNAPPAPRIAAAPSLAMTARDNETADAWIEQIKSGASSLESVLADMAEWPGIVAKIDAAFKPKAAPMPPMPAMPAKPAMPETVAPQDATATILAALASMGDRLATIEAKRGPGRPAKAKAA
jgi:hypothetical protein